MKHYLVDTSAYSRSQRHDPAAMALLNQAEQLYISPIVLGELRAGFLKGGRVRDNEKGLGEFLESPRAQMMILDDETSHCYAAILDTLRRAGTPVSLNDLWIAASAMQHGLCILTADADFQKIPQVMVELITSQSV